MTCLWVQYNMFYEPNLSTWHYFYNRYRSSAPGGMYKPPGGYGDRYDYGSRDDERSSYGREREYGYRDDDRNSRDGDRHSRDSEDRYGRDGNREDDYRGRSRSVDNFPHGSRGRSSDRERTFEDDGHSSSRYVDKQVKFKLAVRLDLKTYGTILRFNQHNLVT